MRYFLAALVCAPSCLHAETHKAFTVQFSDCSEFAGWGPTSLAVAQTLVPAGYTIAGASNGNAAVVVRITRCAGAKVEGTKAVPTILSQIGINLVAPDGTGDINNYTLLYVSNNPFLVQAFRAAGVPARFDPAIAYDYTLNGAATGGTLYGAVQNAGVPAYFVYGAEGEPPAGSAQVFLANWWYGANQKIKQSTDFPSISFGTSSVAVYTALESPLSLLFGGNSDSNFSYLSVRGEYPAAKMVVTVRTQ